MYNFAFQHGMEPSPTLLPATVAPSATGRCHRLAIVVGAHVTTSGLRIATPTPRAPSA
jgi:hypothetical protein